MSDEANGIPGFKVVFTLVGVLFATLGLSLVFRGVAVLRDFGVPESDLASAVLEDFFLFFYELIVFVGVLMILIGHVTTGRRNQLFAASVFTLGSLLFALRDLSTSDSRFGSRLYHGDATLVFVAVDLGWVAAFGSLVVRGLRRRRSG